MSRALGSTAYSTDLDACNANITAANTAITAYNTTRTSLLAQQAVALTNYNSLKAADDAWRADVPYVKMFQAVDLGGTYDKYSVGNYTSAVHNDYYSSVQMSPWSAVNLYKDINYGSTVKSFSNAHSTFQTINLTDYSFNDAVSSLKVIDMKSYSNPALDTAKATLDSLNAQIAALAFPSVSFKCSVYSAGVSCSAASTCTTQLTSCQSAVNAVFTALTSAPADVNALQVTSTRLTTIGIKLTNITGASATYKFKCVQRSTGTTFTTSDVAVLPGIENTYAYVFSGLKHGTQYDLYASKKVITTTYTAYIDPTAVPAATLPVAVVAYGKATSIQVKWTVTGQLVPSLAYRICITPGTTPPASATQFVTTKDVPDTVKYVLSNNDVYDFEVTGVSVNTNYIATLMSAAESQPSTTTSGITGLTGFYIVGHYNVQTVTPAALGVPKARASYFLLNWSGNASYVYAVNDKTTNATLAQSTGPAAAVATTLTLSPGTDYWINLYRVPTTGVLLMEDQEMFTTASSTLSVAEMGSTSVKLTWTKAYDGASYMITYTTPNGATVNSSVYKSDANLFTTISGLQQSTTYVFALSVLENSSAVVLGSVRSSNHGVGGALGTPTFTFGDPNAASNPTGTEVIAIVAVVLFVMTARYALKSH